MWEKKFGWQLDDQIMDGFSASSHSVIGVGTSFKYGTSVNGNIKNGLAVIKIDIETGDTAWCKAVGMYCENPKCVPGEDGLFYIVGAESVVPYRLRVLLLDTNGNVIFRRTLDSTGSIGTNPQKLIRTSDGQFLLTGSMRGFGPGITLDMFALKFDFLGNVLWNNRYNVNPNCSGNHVEETPEGHYVLSGNAGARIWRVEVDSAGLVVDDDFLYQTPTSVVFDQTASVVSYPNFRNSISGSTMGSSQRYYFGLHNQSGNSPDWGGEQLGYMRRSLVNNDGSIIQYRANNAIFHLNKLADDSTVIWSKDLSQRFGAKSVILNTFIYLEDSSAIALGFLFYLTSQSLDFYFCRITNVGVPYDPQNPNTAVKGKTKGESLLPYPNPVASSLVFKGLKQVGLMCLYDLKGQIVKQLEIKPYQRVYISDLPVGLYPYRIQTVNKVYTGKLIKE